MYLRIALRLLARNAEHTRKSITGMAIVIAMIIALFAMISGLSTELSGIVSQAGVSQYLFISSSTESFTDSEIPAEVLSLVDVPAIETSLPAIVMPIKYSGSNGNWHETHFWMVNLTEYALTRENTFIQRGLLPTVLQSTNQTLECLAGMSLGEFDGNSFPTQVTVEVIAPEWFPDQVMNEIQTIDITGVLHASTTLHNTIITEIDSLKAWGIEEPEYYSIIELKIKREADSKETKRIIEKNLAKAGYEDIIVDFEMKNDEFIAELFEEVLNKFEYFLYFLYLIILIKIFHSINWLLITHKPEFTLLKILGMSRGGLLVIVTIMTLTIGYLSLVIGVLLGIVAPILIGQVLGFVMGDGSVNFLAFVLKDSYLIALLIPISIIFVIGGIFGIISSKLLESSPRSLEQVN